MTSQWRLVTLGASSCEVKFLTMLIGDDAGVADWAEGLAPIFKAVNADPACHEFKIHPSRTGPYRTA